MRERKLKSFSALSMLCLLSALSGCGSLGDSSYYDTPEEDALFAQSIGSEIVGVAAALQTARIRDYYSPSDRALVVYSNLDAYLLNLSGGCPKMNPARHFLDIPQMTYLNRNDRIAIYEQGLQDPYTCVILKIYKIAPAEVAAE